MAKLDHSKKNARNRIVRNGSDDITDMNVPAGLTPPKARKSKSQARAEMAEAEAKITRIISCTCGHRASVAIPSAWIGKRHLRCSKCGERSPA